jgi:hypothetical protein
MKFNKKHYLVIPLMVFLGLFSQTIMEWTYQPKEGLVPDEETAIKIAEAIWVPIYGESVLDNKPYNVTLQGDSLWIIVGSLEKGACGGVPYIHIMKSDCRIIRVFHSK